MSNGPRSKHFPELIDWVKKNGGDVDAVCISEFGEEGCGLQALEDKPEGTKVCSVPRKVVENFHPKYPF